MINALVITGGLIAYVVLIRLIAGTWPFHEAIRDAFYSLRRKR